MKGASHVARLDESLLNGVAFLCFRQLDDGGWVVADPYRGARVSSSRQAGEQLRRRVAWHWAWSIPIGLAVAWLPSGAAAGAAGAVAGTVGLVGLAAHREIQKLPEAGFELSKREVRYQRRGLFVPILGVLLLAVGWIAGLATAPTAEALRPMLLGYGGMLALGCIAAGFVIARSR
jgi:hypothetical protein